MWQIFDGRVEISPAFFLLSGWFGLANGWELLGTVMLAAGVHEAGHCLVLLWNGADIRKLRIGVLGAVLETDSGELSYGAEFLAVLAGPAANLAAAAVLALLEHPPVVGIGVHLVLAAFNLLPLYPLDGGRALELMIAWAAGPAAGARAVRWCTVATAAGGCAAAVGVMWSTGGSLWLLPAAAGAAGYGAAELRQRHFVK